MTDRACKEAGMVLVHTPRFQQRLAEAEVARRREELARLKAGG
jgi:hypothetical protein